ncbi:MAG: SIMPL domain-containing protein [Desulfopila sp.]
MRHIVVLFTALFLFTATSYGAESTGTIEVSGSAIITADAEFAVIQAELKATSATVAKSYHSVTQSLIEIAAALKPLGIAKEKIITSAINQGAEYNWSNNVRTLVGYSSACTLKIKLDNLVNTFPVHEKLATFQDLSIGATSYGRNDEEQLRITALQQALDNANQKAQAMAKTLGVELGRVRTARESTSAPSPVMRMEAQFDAPRKDPGEVITTGSVAVSATVQVEYGLK